MAARKTTSRNLREACIEEALGIIETSGVEQLSLREVARRLKVSHQAPYKHFESRDHILAEIIGRAYASFAEYLEKRPRTGEPHEDLAAMGRAYFSYASSHPLQYRLMFGTPLPDPRQHPEMMRQARHAFSLLRDGIARLPEAEGRDGPGQQIDLDALFIWSTIHGLASILQSDALGTLGLSEAALQQAPVHALERLSRAMEPA